MKLVVAVAGVLAVGSGIARAEPDPGPHATGLSLGMRFPWDVTLTPNVVGVGMVGFGLDLGERVTDRLYLGVATEYEMVMNIAKGGPGLEHRFRGGVEARYYFHTGTATMGGGSGGECCCYSEPVEVPRYDWVGARFGEETADAFTSHGAFADVSLGTDAQLGSTQIGAYISAGITTEPAAVYAINPAPYLPRTVTLPEGSLTSYYFTLGMHIAVGG